MRQWWLDRNPRERLILMGGAAAAVLIIAITFIWLPLQRGTTELRGAVAEKTRVLADLRRAQALGTGVDNRGAPPSATQSLIGLIANTGQSHELVFTRTAPDTTGGTDAIRVSFESVKFDDLVEWLTQLERDYGVTVDSFSVNGAPSPGLVTGQTFLRRN
ncbi:MAG TPA: type II secretion system protein M [Gammaproteobacteria bacterium]|jgi:general secretion pathway protein M